MLNFTKRKNKSVDVINVGSQTDAGLIRTENQDSVGVFTFDAADGSKEYLLVVADGMGGHERGSEASAMAVDTLRKCFIDDLDEEPKDRLERVLQLANQRIYLLSQQSGDGVLMGTTCTAVAVSQNRFWIGHVGDSRAYRIGRDTMSQMTEDHTLINGLIKDGSMTEEEAQNDPRKHSLIRAMGVEPKLKPDVFEIPGPENGERILLCSDGLIVVPEEKIAEAIREQDVQDACDELVKLANRHGGPDNITVVVFALS